MDKIKDFLEIEKKRRTEHLNSPECEKLVYTGEEKEYLRIAYIMTSTRVGGGTKIILEHANYLTQRGHKIFLIAHEEKPTWFELDNDVDFIRVPYDEIVGEKIPKDVDLIISTTPSSILECIEQKIAPVLYFEQGDHHLFDRTIDTPERLDFIRKEYNVCNNIFTVSNYARDQIKDIYGKDAHVVSNAINNEVFFPIEKTEDNTIKIAAIGGEDWEFKGIKYILEAIKILKEKYELDFTWITPREPITKIEKTLVSPPQMIIGDTLRDSDIYICASRYESFGLPILEAMSCGTAVITTDVGGNREFSKDGETCLLIEKKNSQDIVDKVEILINDKNLRKKISQKGLEKAREYNWKRAIDEVEAYYKSIAKYTVEK